MPESDRDCAPVAFRWTYGEQLSHDAEQAKKKRKCGLFAAIGSLVGAFLICMILLACAVIRYGSGETQSPVASGEELSITEIADAVTPSVVLISASQNGTPQYGTGFFVTSNGYLVTNYHVIENCDSISVYLSSGHSYVASTVGYREAEDLAVLKVNGNRFQAVTVGDSDALRVGDLTVVIGNPAGFEAAFSTVDGIVSALNRSVTVNQGTYTVELSMIQTSAPVNNGNSGGPMFNSKGEVVGIITRKMTGVEGIGLALPANGSMELVRKIIQNGSAGDTSVDFSRIRPNLAVDAMQSISKGTVFYFNRTKWTAPCAGVFITVSSQNASENGLCSGDIICEIDGVAVADADALAEQLFRYSVGDTAVLKIWRTGSYLEITVSLGTANGI